MDPDEPKMTSRHVLRICFFTAGISIASFAAAAWVLSRAQGWSKLCAAFPLMHGAAHMVLTYAGLKEASERTVEEVLDS